MPQPAQSQPLYPENLHDKGLSKESVLLSYPPELKLKKLNSVALVREQTIPTEQPLPVGEVSANFCG